MAIALPLFHSYRAAPSRPKLMESCHAVPVKILMTVHFPRPDPILERIARVRSFGADDLCADAEIGDVAATVLPVGGWRKRAIDVTASAAALVLLAPLMLVVAACIWATMGGPVIFSQRRVGYGGKTFACYKFRSMINDSQRVLSEHLASNPQAAEEWLRTRKLKSDPRVTRLGHMLRKSSIDELPQLFNILLGHMSCVGPRPVMPDETERYGDYIAFYLRARPGLTGLWQVSGRSRLTYQDRVRLDARYVGEWSLWGDTKIMLRTLPALAAVAETA